MKNRHIIALFLLGLILQLVGTIFMIMHWPFTGRILLVGSIIQITAIFTFIGKVLNSNKYEDFLDS